MARYLFGPVSPEFADQHLRSHREAGDCLAFGPGGDVNLVVHANDTWEDLQARLPAGWTPDFVALRLAAYLPIPRGLWSAPVPLVGLAGDWHLLWHAYRRLLSRCERVLTDAAGVQAFTQQGLSHVRQAYLY